LNIFRKSVERIQAGQATADNMTAHAPCVLNDQGYKHILRILNYFLRQRWLFESASFACLV